MLLLFGSVCHTLCHTGWHTHTHTHTLNLLPEDASHIFGSTWIDGQICCEVTGFLLENVFLSQTLCPISSGSLQDCGCVMKSHREQALKGLLTQRSHLETVARFKKKKYIYISRECENTTVPMSKMSMHCAGVYTDA